MFSTDKNTIAQYSSIETARHEEIILLLQQFHCCIEEERMSQSFGGRGLDEIPLETIEKRGIKYNT